MLSFCYVDRQKSSVGSSEKSQVVHSANWKEQVHLKKELELLRKQENEAIKRITFDQRIVTRKFLHRILRSIDQIKEIEKMKAEIQHVRFQRNGVDKTFLGSQNNGEILYIAATSDCREVRELHSTIKRPKYGQVYGTECRQVRPVTASELQGRAWERKACLMAKNIQRAKSASDMRRHNATNRTIDKRK